MSDEQPKSFNDVLIERQSMRMGHMATQIESLIMQLEQAQVVLGRLGYNLDGTPLETVDPGLNGQQLPLTNERFGDTEPDDAFDASDQGSES